MNAVQKNKDASNREQVVVGFRRVDDNFEPHEDFAGLHKLDLINATIAVCVLKNIICD